MLVHEKVDDFVNLSGTAIIRVDFITVSNRKVWGGFLRGRHKIIVSTHISLLTAMAANYYSQKGERKYEKEIFSNDDGSNDGGNDRFDWMRKLK